METTEQQVRDESFYNRAIAAALRIGFVGLLLVLSYLILKPFLLLQVTEYVSVYVIPEFQELFLFQALLIINTQNSI